MKIEFADQYKICCVVLDGTETAADVIRKAEESEAFIIECVDRETEETEMFYCVRFPGRPPELYTADALYRSLRVVDW